LPEIVLVFEVHQPLRLRKDFFWGNRYFKNIDRRKLAEHYFDSQLDREIFNRIASKCYQPANDLLMRIVDEHKRESKKVKLSFSISGIWVEQCERFNKDLLESFKQLVDTGMVELLGQTYYHSLSSLYEDSSEFEEQIRQHTSAMVDRFNFKPKVFENTELIYNDRIAKVVESLGFAAICTEGAERVLGQLQPNELYLAKGCKNLKVILRNYKLTDDIGFRFSARWWNEWPLTADKYVRWLSQTPGSYICIFPDYETFGEHHWKETGIFEFLKHLPLEILKRDNLSFSTPSEIASNLAPRGEISVPEDSTVSWADMERTTSSWLGNSMQWAYFKSVKEIEKVAKESDDMLTLWRYFGISDHLYYMFTSGGGPGTVHSYFSHHSNPFDAFLSAQAAIMDFAWRVRTTVYSAEHPFVFTDKDGRPVKVVYSLLGFYKALKNMKSDILVGHMKRKDFARWVRLSLHDQKLAVSVSKEIRTKELKTSLIRLVEKRLNERKIGLREIGLS
jgi:alpha-amylase